MNQVAGMPNFLSSASTRAAPITPNSPRETGVGVVMPRAIQPEIASKSNVMQTMCFATRSPFPTSGRPGTTGQSARAPLSFARGLPCLSFPVTTRRIGRSFPTIGLIIRGSTGGGKMRTAKFLALVALCAAAAGACAQAYPSKPIHMVVGFPPGGGNDIIARMVGSKMQEAWGEPVLIDNKPGANSIIAAEHVAKSAPDGYTLLVNATGGMSVNPVLYTKLPYDPLKDFVPISMVGIFPLVLVVHPSVPAKSVQELVAYARANPGKLDYSAGSTAFQVATEMLKQMTGTDIRHIPYKGS